MRRTKTKTTPPTVYVGPAVRKIKSYWKGVRQSAARRKRALAKLPDPLGLRTKKPNPGPRAIVVAPRDGNLARS